MEDNWILAEEEGAVSVGWDRVPERFAEETAYYDKPCTVRICLDEEACVRESIRVDWETDTDGDGAIERGQANPWEANRWRYEEETGTYVKEYTADEDGVYCFFVSFRDLDGEARRYGGTPFVVDQTAPQISAERAGAGTDILVEVQDLCLDQEQTRLYGKKKGGGSVWEELDVTWFQTGDRAVAQVRLDGEETEEIWLKAADLAGNRSEYRLASGAVSAKREQAGGMFFAALIVLACMFLLTVFTGARKIFL